ncbi:adenylate cyclase [Yersinia enterocolitica subsp. enterocolitica]|nr:adenylate cyclase [Yersinia enterocolitica subsp. enterocolitica]
MQLRQNPWMCSAIANTLRGLIRTRIQQLVSECIELRLSSTRQEPGPLQSGGEFPVKHGDCSLSA